MKTVSKLTDKEIAEIALEFKLNYKKLFLKLNKVKVGDKVVTKFKYQKLSYNHRGKASNTVTFDVEGIGTLKEDEQGCLYIESDEEYMFYRLETTWKYAKPTDHYVGEKRKSIIKLGSTTWIN